MSTFVHFSLLVILIFVTYLGSQDVQNYESFDNLRVGFIDYLQKELHTSFQISPKLLDFQELDGRDIRAITCEIDSTNHETGKLCMIRATYFWANSTTPRIVHGNRGSGILCVSYRNISDIPSTILEELNMFGVLKNSTTDHCYSRNQTGTVENPDFWTKAFSDVKVFNTSIDDVVIKIIFPISVDSYVAFHADYGLKQNRTQLLHQCMRQQFTHDNWAAKCYSSETVQLVTHMLSIFMLPNYIK